MATIKISVLGNEYKCRSYFNDDNDQGLEISRYGNHIGSMFGAMLPDEDDEDEVNSFTDKLENWLVDNE